MNTTRAHVPALDGVRGLAILLVLIFHLTLWGHSAADRASVHVIGFGGSGVDLFFVLSGFLITGLLWTSRGPGGLTRFWIRRVLRIWPLYLAVLAALFVLLPAIKGWQEYPMNELWALRWYYWLHATNMKAAIQDVRGLPYNTGHLWSLAVEEQFYVFWPLIVLRIRTLEKLVRASVWTVIVAWALRVVIGVGFRNDIAASMLMPTRMDGFAFGAAIYALGALGRLERWRRTALVAGGVSLVVALSPFNTSTWEVAVIRIAASICHASFLTIILTGSAGLVDRRWLRVLGKYSYGIYVIHPPLILLLAPFAEWCLALPALGGPFGGWSLPATLAYFTGAAALSLALAMLSYHLYERHFLALKDRLAPSPRRDRAAPQPLPAGER